MPMRDVAHNSGAHGSVGVASILHNEWLYTLSVPGTATVAERT